MPPLSDNEAVTIFVNSVGGGGPTVSYEFEDLTFVDSDGTTTSSIKYSGFTSSSSFPDDIPWLSGCAYVHSNISCSDEIFPWPPGSIQEEIEKTIKMRRI